MFGDHTTNDQQAYGATTNGGGQSDQPTLNPPVGNDPTSDSGDGGLQLPDMHANDQQQATPTTDTDAGDYMTDDEGNPSPATTEPSSSDDTSNQSIPQPAMSDAAPAGASNSSDLLDIKQQALQQLTPLVDHLEQSPKEEFRTTMMMIQATDNQDLIKKAFDAAQKIQDDKERAQAFLDIINEINYFTQHPQQ